MRRFLNLAFLSLGGLLACQETTGLQLSEQRIEGITVTVTASALEVTSGEEVQFTVTAHNATDEQVQIGFACGPAMDVMITRPGGGRISVVALAASGRDFVCELTDEHFAEPGETQTLELAWRPAQPGVYTAVGALRASYHQLYNPSEPITITVR